MDTITVRRNGVYISFPSFTLADGNVKDDVIAGTHVEKTKYSDYKKQSQSRNQNRVRPMSKVRIAKSNSVVRAGAKKCMSCGCPCWRSDVSYCWDCYKYQYFESK